MIWGVVAAGALLRALGARGDLWLDELWSIRLAVDAGSIGAVFTRLHHDNNHHLNTLWLLLVGPGGSPLLYRLLAVASATATIALAAAHPLRRGRIESLSTAILVGASYLLVHYGSEARGYAPAMLCAVATFLVIERYLETRRARWCAAFAFLAVLGLLSHLTYVFPLTGAWAWAAVTLVRVDRDRRPSPLAAAFLLVPLASAVALWALDLRHLLIGGGPPWDLLEVLRELSRSALGLPEGLLEILAVPAVAVVALELVAMARERDHRWIFFTVTTVVAPTVLLFVRRPEFLAPRYFVVTVPFVFMLLGAAAGRLVRRGYRAKVVWAVLLGLFLVGNFFPLMRLVRHGRGHYGEAVALIVKLTAAPVITIGSDNDWRNGVVLEDQATRQGVRRRIAYLDASRWSADRPEWLILHDFARQPAPEPFVAVATGRVYQLMATYPYAGLSGWSWLVYRVTTASER